MPVEVRALRQLCVQETQRALARMKGVLAGAKARCVHSQRLSGRRRSVEGTDLQPLDPNTLHLLKRLAHRAAVFAASTCHTKPSRGGRAQLDFDRCLQTLRSERALAPRLVKHLGQLCMHSALASAQKKQLSVTLPRERGVWKDEELQRRMNDVRAEIATDLAQTTELAPTQTGWRGVNLGGWLLWEPGPCNDIPLVQAVKERPPDEWALSEKLRQQFGDDGAERMMKDHRAKYITKRDFEEISNLGMNSVRIPFSYWVVQGPRPGEPYIGPDLEPLDNAFTWAEQTGLSINLCYHGTVGCQSSHQASGRSRDGWDPKEWAPRANVEVLRLVAARYKHKVAFGGLTVVNEPSCQIPLPRLRRYYRDAYAAIRGAGASERVQVILPIYQRWYQDFDGHFREQDGYRNVVFDVHLYHLFSDNWFRMSLASHLRWASGQGRWHDAKDISSAGARVIVSEWCLALPTWDFRSLAAWEWARLSRAEKASVLRCFGQRQLRTFAEHSQGWFFWSWKDEEGDQWNFKESVAKGLLKLGVPEKPRS